MNMKKGLATSAFALSLGFSASALAADAPAVYENLNAPLLAGGCVVCHGDTGESHGFTPSINGINAAGIVERMNGFKDGSRPGTIMGKIAQGYTDAQIAAIAAYFAAQ